jgi:hypothetical protein
MDQQKKARIEVGMEVDSSEAASGAIVALHSATTVADKRILACLRPIVWKLKPYTASESLISDLRKIAFLQMSSSIASEPLKAINDCVGAIYIAARNREAKGLVATYGEHIKEKALLAAVEICNAIQYATLQDIDNSGMKVYSELVPDLQNPGHMKSVVIRPEDVSFWKKCIELSSARHPVCGVGNPGIGKTTTTLYLLQQLLMVKKSQVVQTIRVAFDSGQKDLFYEFLPVIENEQVVDITVKVYRIPAADVETTIPSMEVESAYYVVDPGKFRGSCDNTDQLYEANFIMAASNDSLHWGNREFTKGRMSASKRGQRFLETRPRKKGLHVFGTLWSATQLIAAKPYIDELEGLADSEVLRRFRFVGGSMRDVMLFDDEEEKTFKSDVGAALNLEATTVQELAEGRYMFAFDTGAPSSILIAIAPNGVNSTRFTVALKSDFVEESLASKHLKISWFNFLDEDNAGNRGNLFESYLRLKFSTGQVRFAETEVRESLRGLPSNGKANEKKNYQPVTGGMTIGSARTIIRVPDLIAAVKADHSHQYMLYSRNEREPLIDMICRVNGGYDAIQATVRVQHDGETEKIRKLVTDLGLMGSQRLRIFYAVPSCRYGTFVTNPVNPLLHQSDLNNVFIYHVSVTANE